MPKRYFIITAIGIFLMEWWLLPFLHLQLKINLLAAFLLTVAFRERGSSDKIFLILILTVLAEFWSGGSWGLMSLSMMMTILALTVFGKIIIFSTQHLFISFLWIFLWYHFFAVVTWGGEMLLSGKLENGKNILAGWNFWPVIGVLMVFTIYHHFLEKSHGQGL